MKNTDSSRSLLGALSQQQHPTYQSIVMPDVPPRKLRRSLTPDELRPYLDDPHWRLFRHLMLAFLVLVFVGLLVGAVWICYEEYYHICYPTTRAFRLAATATTTTERVSILAVATTTAEPSPPLINPSVMASITNTTID